MTDNIFQKAAEILMEKGHIKGELNTLHGYCAIGALRAADPAIYPMACEDAMNAMLAKYGYDDREDIPGDLSLHPLARWNDAPERTVEDVVLLFKELGSEGSA